MIVTKKKTAKAILNYLGKSKKVFLIGCAQCATVCKTGGEEQLSDMKILLQEKGKIITGKTVLDPACHLVKVKQFFYQNKNILNKTDAILALTCGDGVQSIKDGDYKKNVLPALDTLFLGEVERGGHFSQKCVLCGDCIIDRTDGICPITICTKGLLNGPCGGSKNKKCEVDKDRDCGWILIYERLKESKKLKNMKKIAKPQDHSKNLKPRKVIL
ncbi:MAG: 5,10-methylenetetrahydrofolate reductase [Dehalococcoidia bacterium]|nr:MAG: 5,10-methylenetetrahydrofolate reductase [Dehalococcoidia bacterium]